jgi:two-component system, chemotaxis family, protein-glutamate methylesterase/glutaminase
MTPRRKPAKNETDLRVLVVDDTVLYRKVISDVLSELPGVVVVGSANNGKAALKKIPELEPDLLTLDIEMPGMDGLSVLLKMAVDAPHVGAIVLSACTREGSKMTLKALELGAFDFIPKPESKTLQENRAELKKSIAPMIKAFTRLRDVRRILNGKPKDVNHRSTTAGKVLGKRPKAAVPLFPARPVLRSNIITIGISTGGPVALAGFLPKLPADMGVPILIAQHMPPGFTESLARNLDRRCAITVKEAVDGEPILPGTAYVAPGGRQMKIASDAFKKEKVIRITDDPPENGCAPSADYLFRSVAEHFGGNATGVIMTGMGSDGTMGLRQMKEKGAFIIAQDEASSVVYGMAKKPVEMGIVDMVVPLSQIADRICRTIGKGFKTE